MGVTYDFSDVDDMLSDYEKEVAEIFTEEGKEYVEDAKRTGSYQDMTGGLRASNYYKASKDELEIGNGKDYASYVESKGFEVSTSAALRTIERLKKRFE